MPRPIHLLIKPASGNCNLRCTYCFYADITEKRETPSFGMMSEETLEAVVRKALERAQGEVTFAFQGGEPTLSGLPFFRRFVELVRAHNTRNLTVHSAIQTNGILLDDEWAAFLAENRFLVGLSLDGTAAVHDLHRVDARGEGTHKRLMAAVRTLQAHKVEFNVLTVVTAKAAREIRSIYAFFRRNQLLYQQYIPCLVPLGEARGISDRGCYYTIEDFTLASDTSRGVSNVVTADEAVFTVREGDLMLFHYSDIHGHGESA